MQASIIRVVSLVKAIRNKPSKIGRRSVSLWLAKLVMTNLQRKEFVFMNFVGDSLRCYASASACHILYF